MTTSQNNSSTQCTFLVKSDRSSIGYYCRSTSPCPVLDAHLNLRSTGDSNNRVIAHDCPCIKAAREFELSILRKEYIEIRRKTVAETCKDVTVF